ncbi:hypothetical protein [Oleiharenicola lentus]|uniref:hypothetical protein n=1 Tax=Oleiharenicola lentus TaxID=2508720 RepID=UPI003F677675
MKISHLLARWQTAFFMAVTLSLCGMAQNKTPAYFYDRYGAPEREINPKAVTLFSESQTVNVKGEFVERVYKSGKMRVTAVFRKPSLSLIQVTYHLPHQWTKEQVSAALLAFDENWASKANPSGVMFSIGHYSSTNGYRASVAFMNLWVLSPEGSNLLGKALAEREAARKEVPKF